MWEQTRARLNDDRYGFGLAAAALYPDVPRVEDTTLLTRPEWIPDAPAPLADVRTHWVPLPDPPAVTSPMAGLPEGFTSYADAMAALARPRVFEDRSSYRLLAVDDLTLTFGPAHYFDGVNVGEAVAHELVADVPGLPVRTAVGDPTDLTRRPSLLAITTLTVTTSGRYVLHWRDPAMVAHAGGLHHVMPVGLFQPLTGRAAELDPWFTMVREYSEELLGASEEYPDDFDQEAWPFHRRMTGALRDGSLRAYHLGLGADPLTLALDLLTVVVFEDEAFDALFGERLVRENEEGRVRLADFDGSVPEPAQPAGAAALRLAWRHRRALGITPRRAP
ncbi:transcriptional regulator [Actinomadura harenae]|uniref:transcriptional regulator n=1 Tax=Actinomadura harenae TaxID=2483351 RepID=UPI0013159D02|nr:transcriptional regulator [Actinomadura harenae]